MRSQVQAPEMGFFRKIRGLSLFDKAKSTDIYHSLDIEPLLLHIEQSQLLWYGHVTKMFHKPTAKQLMFFRVAKGLEGDPEFADKIMSKIWPGHVLEFHQCRIVASCKRLGCLEIPIQAAASETSKGQVGKGKYTELIKCFPRK